MNRRSIIVLATVAAFGFAFLPANSVGQSSEIEKVKAANNAFHVALDSLDIHKMEDVWAHEAYVSLINPRDKAISIGWDAVKRNWETVFAFWSELKTPPHDGPHIQISGNIAWLTAIADTSGKTKTGTSVNNALTFETQILEKRGDRWLIVSHTASRVPQ